MRESAELHRNKENEKKLLTLKITGCIIVIAQMNEEQKPISKERRAYHDLLRVVKQHKPETVEVEPNAQIRSSL